MAAATPTGTDARSATTTSQMVPTSAGNIPPAVMLFVGALNRNSQEIAGAPLTTSVPRISSTGITRATVMRQNTAFATLSLR